MLEDESFIPPVIEGLSAGDFTDTNTQIIVDRLFRFHQTNRKVTPSKLIDSFKGEESVRAYISELTATCENLMDKKKSLDDCIQWIKQNALKRRLKELCNLIKEAQDRGDDHKVVRLVTEYNEMIKELGREQTQRGVPVNE
jgi:replicative DNA helicase